MRGGVADYTALLAGELARLGFEVAVLTSVAATGAPDVPGVVVAPVVKDWGVELWGEATRQIERFRPDVWHVQYQTGAFGMRLGVNLFLWINRARTPRPKAIVTFHDLKAPYVLPKIGRARHLATALIAAGSDAVVVTNAEDFSRVADPSGRTTRRVLGRRPLAPIPIGSNIPAGPPDFDRGVSRARLGIADGELAIAYFGFLGPDKGGETLVDAFRRLLQRGLVARLVMIGASAGNGRGSDEGQIRGLLGEADVAAKVVWTGYLPASDVALALRSCDVCCLPYREGASLRHGTLMAALAQGLAVVTTASAVPPIMTPFPRLVHQTNALLVPPGDAGALTVAIECLAADPTLRRKIAAGAFRLAEAFGWESIAMQHLDLYRQTTGL
jgi:glycosyltransferase involved in cell wall biosynthesis